MLVLSRKVGDKIVIGDNITVTLVRLAGNRVSIGVDAPENVRVMRGEIFESAGTDKTEAFTPSDGKPRTESVDSVDSVATSASPMSVLISETLAP